MENLFSNKNVKEEVKTGNNQQYIYGGVYHNVIIKEITSGESSVKKTPFVRVSMYTKEGGDQTARNFDLYMSENAAETSKKKLKHIATKIVTDAEFSEIEVDTLEEYADALNSLLKGQSLRMKFTQEDYLNNNDEVKQSPRIGLPNFAEATQKGAEYEPVADEDTKLVYDPNNRFDYKKLDVQADVEQDTESKTIDLNI